MDLAPRPCEACGEQEGDETPYKCLPQEGANCAIADETARQGLGRGGDFFDYGPGLAFGQRLLPAEAEAVAVEGVSDHAGVELLDKRR